MNTKTRLRIALNNDPEKLSKIRQLRAELFNVKKLPDKDFYTKSRQFQKYISGEDVGAEDILMQKKGIPLAIHGLSPEERDTLLRSIRMEIDKRKIDSTRFQRILSRKEQEQRQRDVSRKRSLKTIEQKIREGRAISDGDIDFLKRSLRRMVKYGAYRGDDER
jgi:hypothetical protein